MPSRQLTREEIEENLQTQINFLKSSAIAYDAGERAEALRMANAIHQIVGDRGRNSVSLLSQLGRKGGKFLDGTPDYSRPTKVTSAGLVIGEFGDANDWIPPLDDVPSGYFSWVSFDDWWNRTIFTDRSGQTFSRRNIIEWVRDQAGGSHSDSNYKAQFAALSQDNSLGLLVSVEGWQPPLRRPELPAIRQIAHELLKTLIPGYRKAGPPIGGSVVFGSSHLIWTDEEQAEERVPLRPRVIYPPESLCPCGSGKTTAECHADNGRAWGEAARFIPGEIENAWRLFQSGSHADAIAKFEEALAICEREFNEPHLYTASSQFSLGFALAQTGHFTRARMLLEDSLETRKKLLGLNHSKTANTLLKLAFVQAHQEEFKTAHANALLSLEIRTGLADVPPEELNESRQMIRHIEEALHRRRP